MYVGNIGQCVLTTARTDHLPNFLTSRGPLGAARKPGACCPMVGGEFSGAGTSCCSPSSPAVWPRALPGPEQRQGIGDQGGCQGLDAPPPKGPEFLFVSAICHPISRVPRMGSSDS